MVKLHPHDSWDSFDLVAHGVGTAHSEKAALFLHAVNLKGDLGRDLLFHLV